MEPMPSTLRLRSGTRVWIPLDSGARVPAIFVEKSQDVDLVKMTYRSYYNYAPNAHTTVYSVFIDGVECMFVRSIPPIVRPIAFSSVVKWPIAAIAAMNGADDYLFAPTAVCANNRAP